MIPIERFSPDATDILCKCRDLLKEYRHQAVEPEHILLAMIDNPESEGSCLFRRMNVDLGPIRGATRDWLARQPKILSYYENSQLYFTERGRVVVENASNLVGIDAVIGVEQLLLEIVSSNYGMVVETLRKHGVTRERVDYVLSEKEQRENAPVEFSEREQKYLDFYRWWNYRYGEHGENVITLTGLLSRLVKM